MKLILSIFEKLSSLKINFHKNNLFCFGQVQDCQEQYSNIFGCKLDTFLVRYLGIPMHENLVTNSWLALVSVVPDWFPVTSRGSDSAALPLASACSVEVVSALGLEPP